MLRRTINRTPLLMLSILASVSGCASGPSIIVPSCDRPAWLDGKFDSAAPGYTVTLAEGVTDRAAVAKELSRRFSFELDDQYQTAVEGFATRMLTPDALAELRCDPRVAGVSFNELIRMRGR